MAIYSVGSYIREQRERLGISQEGLCEGICSAATLSKIENGHQDIHLKEYIMLMQRLDQPMQSIGVTVSQRELRQYNLKNEIEYKMAMGDMEVEELLGQYQGSTKRSSNQTMQYVAFVRAMIKKYRGEADGEVMGLLLRAIRYTYRKFDINRTGSVRLLTFDEIRIIDNIAVMLAGRGDVSLAIEWENFLKNYLETGEVDYEEVTRAYPQVLFNLTKCFGECNMYGKAVELCTLGIDYCIRHGRLDFFARLLDSKGYYLEKLGKREEASECLSYAYMIFGAKGDKERAEIARKELVNNLGVKEIIL